jgi:cell division protein ZapE
VAAQAPQVIAAKAGVLRQRYEAEAVARGFAPDQAQLSVLARLEDLRTRLCGAAPPRTWLAKLLRPQRRQIVRGLYLWGAVGRGKTWLMDLFYDSLPQGYGRRLHFHRFMHEVHAQLRTLREQRAPLEQVAAGIGGDSRVLCFDELFVTDIADAMILGGLFESLLARGVTLVATSNVPPGELYKGGLQRQRFEPAIALLEAQLEVLQLAGPTDYRLRQLTQAGTYLPAGASTAEAQLRRLFAELGGHAREGGVIEIEARSIPVVRLAHGAAWFEFSDLCAGARSQEDYIEIAREFHSVLLSNVPLLEDEHDNEARRLIALVDELYDHNVKLIVSAAAAPADLYRGDRLRAMFARTASRLIEMQSADYLAREHRP